MGECPTWYRLLVAAKYLGVPPWELQAAPWRYVLQAEAAMSAEAAARKHHADRAAR